VRIENPSKLEHPQAAEFSEAEKTIEAGEKSQSQ
jgi:hypothetical protein